MPIIDPRHHLWDRGSRYLLEEIKRDIDLGGHNIRATVFLQCDSMYRADGDPKFVPIGETEFVNGVAASGMAKLVRRLRTVAGLPATFTLDACRYGGMTEPEEAELTDGQGRALSAHKSRAYEGYAKANDGKGACSDAKRHAHRIAASPNAQGTEFRNEAQNEFRNDDGGSSSAAK